MKHNLWGAIAYAGLLLFPVSVVVQASPESVVDSAWHQSRDQYFNEAGWRANMFDRIGTDLDHIQPIAPGQPGEDRVADTKQQVAELQKELTAGKYDQPGLDLAISGLEKVVADNRLCARDRDMLADDLIRVREYRASHETWR